MRACDRCKAAMAPGRPRVRVGGKQLWCQTCVKDKAAPSGRYRPGTDIASTASAEPHLYDQDNWKEGDRVHTDFGLGTIMGPPTPDRTGRNRHPVMHDSGGFIHYLPSQMTPSGGKSFFDHVNDAIATAALIPTPLGLTASVRRTTASDDDFAAHFNDQMQGSEGKALGEHLWDGMAKAMGYADGDHMQVSRQNRDHEELAKRYEGQPGKTGMDESGEPHYEIHHPASGWIGRMNVGPYMEISHQSTPNETHEVLDVGHSDSNGHVLHPSMKTDDPLVNHHRAHWALDNFVKEHGAEYADNIPKIKRWQSRRGLSSQGSSMTIQRLAHDSGDGETIYHCGRGSERYWTRDGLKTLGETVGTVQWVLTNTGSGGVWREAMIHSFGEQSLLKVTLKRGKQIKVTYWTPEHRWLVRVRQDPTRAEAKMVTTADLKPGDALSWLLPKSRIGTSSPSQFGIAHGVTYGDGTKAALGATVNLWGEKDAQLLRYFSESPQGIVKTAMGVLGVHVTGLPAFFKDRPSLDESIPYLYGWLAGYFAADGHVDQNGQVCLDSASKEDLEFVQTLAARIGIATNDISMKVRQGYGDEPSAIYKMSFIASTLRPDFFLIKEHRERYQARLDRGITEKIGWVVELVEDEGLVEEVFCPRVPEHENFVLDGWINTMNCPFCGSGQVIARSDGTIDCEFCHTMFTVQVQPEYPAFPQTIDGQPVQVPGMPGQIDAPPMDPSQVGPDGMPMDPAADPNADPAADPAANPAAADDSGGNQPPWLKGAALTTATGSVLDPEDFIAHLAIKHADDKTAVIKQVRASRRSQ